MSARWGFNANGNAVGDVDFYLKTVEAWQAPAQLIMNGINAGEPNNVVMRAAAIQEKHGGIVIYRPYEQSFEGRPHLRPVGAHIAFLRRFAAPHLWYNVANEPKPDGEAETRQMCKWYADLIRNAGDLRLVVYNCGVGTFEKWQIEAGWFDDLIIALADNAHKTVNVGGVAWPQFMLGSHAAAYWHGVPSVHTAGRNPTDLIHPERLKEADWPTVDQIFDADTSNNWIVFRDWWFIERARKLRPNAPDIRIIATEAGFENLPNIRTQFPDVVRKMDELCGRETRGLPTIRKYLEWAFPDQSADESACDCCWFIETRAPVVYRAFLHFSWTWHNDKPDWWKDNYNVGEQWGFLTRWPQFVAERSHPPPPTIPLPLPVPPSAGDPRYVTMVLSTLGSKSHVRKYPTTAAEILLTFVASEGRIIPLGMLTDEEKHSDQLDDGSFAYWLPVIIGGVQGWCRNDAIELLLFEPPKPPPYEPPPAPPEFPPDGDDEAPPTIPSEPSDEELALIELRRAWLSVGEACNKLAIASAHYADVLRKKESQIREARLNPAA